MWRARSVVVCNYYSIAVGKAVVLGLTLCRSTLQYRGHKAVGLECITGRDETSKEASLRGRSRTNFTSLHLVTVLLFAFLDVRTSTICNRCISSSPLTMNSIPVRTAAGAPGTRSAPTRRLLGRPLPLLRRAGGSSASSSAPTNCGTTSC